jgi:Fe2+ or Zn2+ uptake regulation protein
MFNPRWKARHVASAFQPMLAPVAFETFSAVPPYPQTARSNVSRSAEFENTLRPRLAMTNKQRTDLIERHLRENKYADLHSLADRFSGSLSTVRRALDSLESRGIVRRHHGGASLIENDALTHEHDFLVRIQRQADQKFAIASLVA